MAKVKFKDMPKQDRIFRIVNLSIMGTLMLLCLIMMIYYFAVGNPEKRATTSILMILFLAVPYLIELVFRFRLSKVFFLIIEIYLFFAGVLGSVFGFYTLFDWYDVLIHTVMGYFVALIGLFVISRLTKYKDISPIAVALFCLFFSLGVELVWEISEYIVDIAFGRTMQGAKFGTDEFGNMVPLVTDTVLDLCCNFTGALTFFLQFVIGKYTRLHLAIPSIEAEIIQSTKMEKPEEVMLKQDVSENKPLQPNQVRKKIVLKQKDENLKE